MEDHGHLEIRERRLVEFIGETKGDSAVDEIHFHRQHQFTGRNGPQISHATAKAVIAADIWTRMKRKGACRPANKRNNSLFPGTESREHGKR